LQIAEAAFYYLIHNKLYLWKHMRSKKKAVATMRTNKNSQVEIPNMSNSQIKQIAWNLDINENVMHADITRRDELAKQQAPSLSTAKHLKLEI
jgi:5-hydroxyisourate hydrolase-like protein (transthyretin family)